MFIIFNQHFVILNAHVVHRGRFKTIFKDSPLFANLPHQNYLSMK